MKSSRKWLWFLLLVLLVVLGWKYLKPHGAGSADALRGAEDPSMAIDRVWVDSKPDKYTDYVNAVLMLDYVPMGMFQKASAYHVILELFEYKRKGNNVRAHFPQTDKSRGFSYKVTSCDDLPPFDLCLTVNDNPWGGPTRYYGLRDADSEASILGHLRQGLEARLPAGTTPR